MKNLKLLLSGALLAVSATALADTVDVTAKVGTGKSDWNGSNTYGVTVTTSDGRTVNMVELYDKSGNGGSHADNKVLSQTVTGLDNGTYHVTLFATTQNDWCSSFASNYKNGSWTELYSYDITDLFATSGDNTVKTPVKAKGYDENRGYSTPGEYTLDIDVTDGQLEMGMILNQTSMMDWFTIQIKSLTREVTDARAAVVEEAQNALVADEYANITGDERQDLSSSLLDPNKTADELTALLNTFTLAKDSYDTYAETYTKGMNILKTSYISTSALEPLDNALANLPNSAAEAKTATTAINAAIPAAHYSAALAEACADRADYTSVITNPQATDGINGWTKEKGSMGTLNEQLNVDAVTYPNKAIGYYFDSWQNGAWTSLFSQTTTAVPAGKYRLAFISRAQTTFTDYNVVVKVGNKTYEQSLLPVHDDVNGEYGRGWDQQILDFDVETAGTIYLAISGSSSASAWLGFTDFTLTKLDPTAQVSELDLARAEAKALLANTEEYGSVWEHSEYVALEDLCDKADDEVTVEEIKAAIETFKAAKAGYDALSALLDAYAAYAKASDACPNADADKVKAFQEAYDADPDPAAEALAHTEVLSAAYREMIYSEAIAEGLADRFDYTSVITNPAAEDAINGWTLKQGDGNGKIGTASVAAQQPTNYPNADFAGNYFDGGSWGDSDWTTVFEQTTAAVPAGTYRLSFIARGSTSLIWAYVKINDSVRKDFVLNGDQNGDYGTGWNQVYVDYTTGQTPETLKIDICASTKSQHQWHSFTDFKLVYLNSTTGIENVAVDAATDAPAVIYDLYGRRVANPGTGIYIVNGRKVVLRK